MELVLDKKDSLEDPSSTAKPIAQLAQAVRGMERHGKKRLKGIKGHRQIE